MDIGHPDQPTVPLLRLRIELENEQQFINTRDLHVELGLDQLVANPDDVVKLVRKRNVQEKTKVDVDQEAWDNVFNMQVSFFIKSLLQSNIYIFLIVNQHGGRASGELTGGLLQ